jgi:hypothetical protein
MDWNKWKLPGVTMFVLSVGFFALAIFYFVFSAYVEMFGTVRVHDAAVWGQFGDFVGGLTNPILSFLGLIVLLQTFRYQLDTSRRQIAVSEIEKFENTFFKMVDRFEINASALFRNPKNENYPKTLRVKLLRMNEEISQMNWAEGLKAAEQHVKNIVVSDADRIHSFARKFSQCLYFVEKSSLENSQKEFYFSYALEAFMKYEHTIFMAVVFVRSPDSVEIIRKYKLASRLKETAFCCSQVRELYNGRDFDGAYPLVRTTPVDEDLKVDVQ